MFRKLFTIARNIKRTLIPAGPFANCWQPGTWLLAFIGLHSPAQATDLRFENGRIVLETADNAVKLRTGGRIQIDAVAFGGDSKFADAVRFRRLRANMSGDIYDKWHFKVEYEFVKRDEGWRSLWASYTGIQHTTIILGNQRAPVSLENVTGSSELTMLERSTMNAFLQPDYLGGSVVSHGQDWTASMGVFRESITSRHTKPNRGMTYSGRLTWTPIRKDHEVLHLGLSAAILDFGAGGTYKVAAHPLVGITPDHLVNTHVLHNVSSASVIGLEVAWSDGPFRLQSEYSADIVRRLGLSDSIFHGGYAQASWVLTGEPYRYNQATGVFDGVRPDSALGAVEVAARFGTLDLQDSGVTGGRQDDMTLGVNWYPNRILRIGANFIWANADPDSSAKNQSLEAGLMRVQLNL